MSNDLNLCQFIGRLGADPETRYLPSGDAVTNFTVASGEKWKDKQGQPQESTEWVRCASFGKLAEICGEYLRKGSQVYVSGKMKTRKYQAQDGSDRYSTEVVINQMQMLGSKPEGQQAPQRAEQQQEARQQPAHTHGKQQAGGFDDFDDQLPDF